MRLIKLGYKIYSLELLKEKIECKSVCLSDHSISLSLIVVVNVVVIKVVVEIVEVGY